MRRCVVVGAPHSAVAGAHPDPNQNGALLTVARPPDNDHHHHHPDTLPAPAAATTTAAHLGGEATTP